MVKNVQYHGRAKHIDILSIILSENMYTAIATVKLEYCSSEEMVADIFTTRGKIHQVDATLFVEQRLNNVVIMVQQHLLNLQC